MANVSAPMVQIINIISFASPLPLLGYYAFMDVLEYDEENRNHKKQSEGAEQQAANSPDTNRNITIGANS